jgi:hypothetical protein
LLEANARAASCLQDTLLLSWRQLVFWLNDRLQYTAANKGIKNNPYANAKKGTTIWPVALAASMDC